MYSSVPYDKELLLFLAIVIIPFVIVAVYAHRQEKKKMQRKKEPAAAIQVEPPQKPAEIVPQPEDPKVSALRSAARQSLQINILALEAQRQMANMWTTAFSISSVASRNAVPLTANLAVIG